MIVAKSVASEPMNLQRRGNLFWTNLRLPQMAGHTLNLQSGPVRVGKNGYLRVSLSTGDRKEAEKRARRLAVEIDDALDALDALTVAKTRATEPITPDDIQLAADLMRGALLAADDDAHTEALGAALADTTPDRSPDRELAAAVKLPPPGAAGDVKLLKMLVELIPFYVNQATGKTPTGVITPDYAPFAAAFRSLHADLLARGAGQPVPTPPDPREAAKAKAAKAKHAFSWDDLLAYYLAAHPALSPRSRALYHLTIKALAAFCKCPPADLRRVQVVAWRDLLAAQLAPKTALTRVRASRTLYYYALVNEQLGDPAPADAFASVTVAGAKSAKSSRREFSLENLKRIFAAPLPALPDIPASAGAHAALWLPLIALFTGARREEILGLLASEVVQDPATGIWYFDIKDNELRKVKVDSCTRKTPVHASLIELGFIDYVSAVHKASVKRLFPGVVSGNACAEYVINFIRSRIDAPGGIKQDNHSFRHSFKTATRSVPLGTEIHDALTGHKAASAGSSGDYGSPAWLSTLKAEIDKVTYPGVSFTPPPLPTPAELKALQAAAARRALNGRNRMLGKLAATARAIRAARVQVRRGRPHKAAQPAE